MSRVYMPYLVSAGVLCGECTENRGVTLDLRECSPISCYWGLGLFLFLCELQPD